MLKLIPDPEGVGFGRPLQNGLTLTQNRIFIDCLGYSIALLTVALSKIALEVKFKKLGFTVAVVNSKGYGVFYIVYGS